MSTSERDSLNILWVKAGPLLPANTGGRIRTVNMLRAMAKRHKITFLALRDPSQKDDEDNLEAADYAQERLFVPFKDAARGSLPFFAGVLKNFLLSRLPYVMTKYLSGELEKRIREFDASGKYDLLVCDFLTPALCFPAAGTRTRSVIFQHNIESLIWERMASNAGSFPSRFYLRGQQRRMERCETELCHRFGGTITVSPDDSRLACERFGLRNLLGDVPAGVNSEFFASIATQPPDTAVPTLGFLGSMDWLPNIEGVRWFHEHVLTALRQQVPGVKLLIIGRNPPASLRQLADGDPLIEFTGTVPDVRPFVQRCTAMIVPLLTGGGTRIKILEMMAAGRPIVSTTVGAEGLGMEHGKHLLLADEPATFVKACASLFQQPSLAKQLCDEAIARVKNEHSWERAADTFLSLAMGNTESR